MISYSWVLVVSCYWLNEVGLLCQLWIIYKVCSQILLSFFYHIEVNSLNKLNINLKALVYFKSIKYLKVCYISNCPCFWPAVFLVHSCTHGTLRCRTVNVPLFRLDAWLGSASWASCWITCSRRWTSTCWDPAAPASSATPFSTRTSSAIRMPTTGSSASSWCVYFCDRVPYRKT